MQTRLGIEMLENVFSKDHFNRIVVKRHPTSTIPPENSGRAVKVYVYPPDRGIGSASDI
jgi:hypothetical protein